jgi:hypothetical protein
MAIAILCGLMTSTLLNMVVVPTMYLRLAGRRRASGRAMSGSGDSKPTLHLFWSSFERTTPLRVRTGDTGSGIPLPPLMNPGIGRLERLEC